MAIPIAQLSKITAQTAQQLQRLGLSSSDDLLFHLPRDYEDRSTRIPIADAQLGRTVLLQGEVKSHEFAAGKRRSLAVQLSDGSGRITLRFYHVYSALLEKLAVGKVVRVFGEVRLGVRGAELYHPELLDASEPLTGQAALSPIYPTTEGLRQATLRRLVDLALQHADELPELLPAQVLQPMPFGSYQLGQALRFIHHPPVQSQVALLAQAQHPAQQRLLFEELIAHQVSLLQRRQYVQQTRAPQVRPTGQVQAKLLATLPFQPTGAQRRVTAEILQDLARSKPMLRLVQGDVGAGKTLVAAQAACAVLDSGGQVALMAPTEILAEQHAINFDRWFAPLGFRVVFLAGRLGSRARQQALTCIADGTAQLVIGTHALFQDQVQFADLRLVIIDEQHRFGVDQRLALREKGQQGSTPHQLVMTATPIPRTLAMSAYGDLDTSIIDELPPGRTPIQTVALPIERRTQVLQRIYDNCRQGRQAYWVCTLVEQSETLDAQAAEAIYAEVCQQFPDLQIGLVHGKLKPDDKQRVMKQFKDNQLQLLVATTVIEVGVDVPNASIMVIENAERLGLSQLHQLRGRVGRGAQQSFCVLLYKSPLSQNGQARLDILRQSNDGFEIAERDLEWRGPGDLMGTRQTGTLDFRVADLARDAYLLEPAHAAAALIIRDYPQQADALLQRWLPDAPRYAYV